MSAEMAGLHPSFHSEIPSVGNTVKRVKNRVRRVFGVSNQAEPSGAVGQEASSTEASAIEPVFPPVEMMQAVIALPQQVKEAIAVWGMASGDEKPANYGIYRADPNGRLISVVQIYEHVECATQGINKLRGDAWRAENFYGAPYRYELYSAITGFPAKEVRRSGLTTAGSLRTTAKNRPKI